MRNVAGVFIAGGLMCRQAAAMVCGGLDCPVGTMATDLWGGGRADDP